VSAAGSSPGALAEVGPYVLTRTLGEGALGTTYLAIRRGQESASRWFVLRILHRHLWTDLAATALLLEEARTANRLKHPNVVQVVDTGRAPNGVPYIVMEYAAGPSLAAIATASRLRPDGQRYWCAVLASVLAGVGHAHEARIVHGAITPADIRVNEDGVPKLLGLEASQLRESLEDTFSHRMERQLRYAAPELLRVGGRPGPAADVYAIAVCAWEGLTRRQMFEGLTTAELMRRRMQGQVPSLLDLAPDLAPEVVTALEAALSVDPHARPTVSLLAQSLRLGAAGAQPSDVADWIDALFQVDEDGATRVFGAVFEEPGLRGPFGTPLPLTRTATPTPIATSFRSSRPVPPRAPTVAPPPAAPPAPAPPSPLLSITTGFTMPPMRTLSPASRWAAGGLALALGLGALWWVSRDATGSDIGGILTQARTELEAGQPELALALIGRVRTDDPRWLAEIVRLNSVASHRLEIDRARIDLVKGQLDSAEARVRAALLDYPEEPYALAVLEEIRQAKKK
jgi:serine/threonine protein kinase